MSKTERVKYTKLNSIVDKGGQSDEPKKRKGRYESLEKNVGKKGIKSTIYIAKIRNIQRDVTQENFEIFEELGDANDWDDEEMGSDQLT